MLDIQENQVITIVSSQIYPCMYKPVPANEEASVALTDLVEIKGIHKVQQHQSPIFVQKHCFVIVYCTLLHSFGSL